MQKLGCVEALDDLGDVKGAGHKIGRGSIQALVCLDACSVADWVM